MLFYSKLEDSLKTKLVKVIIGTIRLGEGSIHDALFRVGKEGK